MGAKKQTSVGLLAYYSFMHSAIQIICKLSETPIAFAYSHRPLYHPLRVAVKIISGKVISLYRKKTKQTIAKRLVKRQYDVVSPAMYSSINPLPRSHRTTGLPNAGHIVILIKYIIM